MKNYLRIQKLVILTGGLIAVTMVLFPPYMEFYQNEQGSFSKISHGHHFIFKPPQSAFPQKTQGIMWENSEFTPRLVILGILTFVIHEVVAHVKKRKTKE